MAEHTHTTTTSPMPQALNQARAPDPAKREEYYAKFFLSEPPPIPPAFAELLEQYSGVPTRAQAEHVLRTRDQAWKHHPFPCLGRFRFLELDLSNHPLYKSDLLPLLTAPSPSTATNEPIFLDIGSCLGQDLRKLIHDGVPAGRVYGADLEWAFIDAGYALFADEARLPRSHFLVPADLFARRGSDGDGLARLDGACDVVSLTAVFHLFDRPAHCEIVDRVVRLLRPDTGRRKLVLGMHLGMEEVQVEDRPDGRKFRHNMHSWTELWDEVLGGEGWKASGIVKGWEVGGRLEKRTRHVRNPHADSSEGGSQMVESPYRWQIWWVWVQF